MIAFKHLFVLLAVFAVYIGAFLLIRNNPRYDDEPTLYYQIVLLTNNRFRSSYGHPKFPGYPLFVSFFTKLFKTTSYPFIRLLNLILSLFGVFIFYSVAKNIDVKSAILKTAQFAFLPILFPYLFLMYSESLEIVLVLVSLYLAFNKKYFLSLIFSSLNIYIRQSNVVWYVFQLCFLFYQLYKHQVTKEHIRLFILKIWYGFIPLVLFLLFVILNHGYAIGERRMYPPFTIHSGNLIWALFCVFFLFLPHHVYHYKLIASNVLKRKKIMLWILVFFATGILTFSNSHPWNQYQEHVRNKILVYFDSSVLLKSLFFIPIIYSVLSLSTTKLAFPFFYSLYPFTVLALAPIWMIETRYFLIPLVLFILFRQSKSLKVEYSILTLWVILSIIFFEGYLHQKYYL